MGRISARGRSIARFIVIAAVFVFSSLTASAAGLVTHAPMHLEHGTAGDYRTNTALDAMEHLGFPVEKPLHCHIKSLHTQANAPAQVTFEEDSPALASIIPSAPTWQTQIRLPAASAFIPFAGPPRFIFFGNFRS